MRLLHTADWHLGKTLRGQSLIDDQKFILDEIFHVINDEKIDAVIIAGDVYDRAVPPAEAVNLFDETLNRFVEKKIPVLIIAGNHDSAARLNFGSKIFESNNIFIASKIADKPANIVLTDEFGEIYFSLIPFFVPAEIHEKFPVEETDTFNFNAANKIYVDELRKKIPAGKRNVAVAHVFATGGEESESERKFVGGTANVNTEIFSGCDYVAFGHLHKPQKISAENIRYSGSPLKYSFDEVNYKKGVTVVELDGNGFVSAKNIALTPKKDLIVVEGSFAELMKRPKCDDYAQVILTDENFIPNARDNLRDAVFENLLDFRRKSHLTSYDEQPANRLRKDEPISEQFGNFFGYVTGTELSDEERTAFNDFLRTLNREMEATQ